MHQIRFWRGCAPDTAGGAYSASQTAYLDLRGLLLREERGKDGNGRGRGNWEGREGIGRGGEVREETPKGWLIPPCSKS